MFVVVITPYIKDPQYLFMLSYMRLAATRHIFLMQDELQLRRQSAPSILTTTAHAAGQLKESLDILAVEDFESLPPHPPKTKDFVS